MTEKLVTIVMPVGADAGKKVKVTEAQASAIETTFGTFRPEKANPNEAAIASLREQLASASQSASESIALLDAVQEIVTADKADAEKLAGISALLSGSAA